MPILVGVLIVISAVLGGFVLSHGDIASLWQPFELLIIGGAALGAFVIANPVSVTVALGKKLPQLFTTSPYSKVLFLDLLSLLYELMNLRRRKGNMALEAHIENAKQSSIFKKYRMVAKKPAINEFICDYFRLLLAGEISAHELDNLIDAELETHHQEHFAPSMALGKVADALPGFGIVAAVLGIVITMQSLGGPPEEIGVHVAAALVGTFLGILLAYGFIGPLSQALEHRAAEEGKVYECIKACLVASINGAPPQVAIEFGRKMLYATVRPSFYELESQVRGR